MYDISKVHYQCNTDIFLTSKRFIPEIICGELLPVIWDDEVAELLEHSFTKHNVKIRMMCGPEVYAFTDGSNPVWDVYKSIPISGSFGSSRTIRRSNKVIGLTAISTWK